MSTMVNISSQILDVLDAAIEKALVLQDCMARFGLQQKKQSAMAAMLNQILAEDSCNGVFESFCLPLSYQELLCLISIMYAGRDLTGQVEYVTLEKQMADLKSVFPTRDRIIQQMISKPALAKYLILGREYFGLTR